MQAQCSWNAGPVQLECRPCAARMQSRHSLIAGPVQLEGRPRVLDRKNLVAGMHAERRSSAASCAARGDNQCQRQGQILPWRPETAANSNAKVTSYLGTPRQQPSPVPQQNHILGAPRQQPRPPPRWDHTLAPQCSSQCKRQGKIIPWWPETIIPWPSKAVVRSYLSAPSQQAIAAAS